MVPDGWRVCKLNTLCTSITVGLAISVTPFMRETGVKLIRNQNIKRNKFDESSIIYLDDDFAKRNKSKYVKAGDVIAVRTGSNIGESCVVPKHFENSLTFTTLIARPDKNHLNPYYLSSHINSEIGISEVNRLMAGGGKPNLNSSELKNYKILTPPINEQLKIAKILSTWDKAIYNAEQLIASCTQQKKWLMQNLLTGKNRLPGFNNNWVSYSLNRLIKQVKRPVEWNDDDEYKLLSVKRRSEGVILREVLLGHQILTKKMNIVEEGDFLISKMQVVHGAMGLVTKAFHKHHISDSYIGLRSKDESKLNIDFFSWYCKQKSIYHKAFLCSYGVHIEKGRAGPTSSKSR